MIIEKTIFLNGVTSNYTKEVTPFFLFLKRKEIINENIITK
jgi:hypothetical protein